MVHTFAHRSLTVKRLADVIVQKVQHDDVDDSDEEMHGVCVPAHIVSGIIFAVMFGKLNACVAW